MTTPRTISDPSQNLSSTLLTPDATTSLNPPQTPSSTGSDELVHSDSKTSMNSQLNTPSAAIDLRLPTTTSIAKSTELNLISSTPLQLQTAADIVRVTFEAATTFTQQQSAKLEELKNQQTLYAQQQREQEAARLEEQKRQTNAIRTLASATHDVRKQQKQLLKDSALGLKNSRELLKSVQVAKEAGVVSKSELEAAQIRFDNAQKEDKRQISRLAKTVDELQQDLKRTQSALSQALAEGTASKKETERLTKEQESLRANGRKTEELLKQSEAKNQALLLELRQIQSNNNELELKMRALVEDNQRKDRTIKHIRQERDEANKRNREILKLPNPNSPFNPAMLSQAAVTSSPQFPGFLPGPPFTPPQQFSGYYGAQFTSPQQFTGYYGAQAFPGAQFTSSQQFPEYVEETELPHSQMQQMYMPVQAQMPQTQPQYFDQPNPVSGFNPAPSSSNNLSNSPSGPAEQKWPSAGTPGVASSSSRGLFAPQPQQHNSAAAAATAPASAAVATTADSNNFAGGASNQIQTGLHA